MAVSPDACVNQYRLSQEAVLAAVLKMKEWLRDPAATRRSWPALREQLFTFFGRQDRGFFSALQEFFARDREAEKMLEFLECDLKELKLTLAELEAKYGEGGAAARRVAPRDFTELAGRVVGRIRLEEEYLVPLLEKYVRGRGAWPSPPG
jgi:hypothetical protein